MSGKTKIYGNRRWVVLMFAVVMFAAGGTCSWLGIASARARADGWWMPLLMGAVALAAAGGATYAMLNEWRHEQPLEAGAGRRYRLRPDTSALMKFLGWLGLALVWNGFISLAVVLLILKGPGSPGRLACLGGFGLAFTAPGIWLIAQAIAQGRLLIRRDRTRAEISLETIRLGDQATVRVRHWSRVDVEKIAVKILHQEHRRANRRPVARTLYQRLLGERRRLEAAACQPCEHTLTLDIPPDRHPSGREAEYGPYYTWKIVILVQPAGQPAYERTFPLTVLRPLA
jgi:hypothetical protein